MARFDDYIDSIMSTASGSSYNIILADQADWTILFAQDEEITACSVEEITGDSMILYPLLDFYYENINNHTFASDVASITADVYRFRFRWFRGKGDAGVQPLHDNQEVGRQASWMFRLSYTTADAVDHTYTFMVQRQSTKGDYTWKSLDSDEANDRYFP